MSQSFAPRFAVELDGINVGFCSSFKGGLAKAKVIEHNLGPSLVRAKQIGNVEYNPVSMKFGIGMSKFIFDQMWQNMRQASEKARIDGAGIYATYDGKIQHRIDFFSAICKKITLPKVDAAADNPGEIEFELQPTYTRYSDGDGSSQLSWEANDDKVKQFVLANFDIRIGDLPTGTVTAVTPPSIEVETAIEQVGNRRDPNVYAAALKIGELSVDMFINYKDAKKWMETYDAYIQQGANYKSSHNLDIQLDYQTPDFQTVATVDFIGCGLTEISFADREANKTDLMKMTAKFFVTDVDLETSGGFSAA